MNKAKISIALTKSLLNQIDSDCKQTGLSRSSFIEIILRQYWRSNLVEAILLEKFPPGKSSRTQ